MHHTPTPAALATDTDDAAYYRRVLHRLVDIGAELAERLVQAEASPPDAPDADKIAAFDRLARAIRRTIVLARHVAEPVAPGGHRVAARKRIIRAVEDAIQRRTDPQEGESLRAELLDRLDGPELDDEIRDRPVEEIIADICRDLGIASPPGAHPWLRRRPGDVAVLCALAARPGVEPPDVRLHSREQVAGPPPWIRDG